MKEYAQKALPAEAVDEISQVCNEMAQEGWELFRAGEPEPSGLRILIFEREKRVPRQAPELVRTVSGTGRVFHGYRR